MTIQDFLTSIQLGHLREHFEKNRIDVDQLSSLTDEDLRELGINALGERKRILAAARTSVAARDQSSDALAGATQFASAHGHNEPRRKGRAPSDAAAFARTISAGSTQFTTGIASVADTSVGQKLRGRYQLLAEVGRGAMGIVYRAFDDVTKLDVAVKTLVPEHVGNPELVGQMAKEVALAQQVSHPNLLRVHHMETGASPFLVMEYVDGGTLTERWESRQRKMPVDEVLSILDAVLDGLSALHARNLFHRDVKPDNVLISRAGEVKLADYGVASTLREQLAGASRGGTPLYMAPEQLQGERVDARSDLYAVGMMAYQLLLGRYPFSKMSLEAAKSWHFAGDRSLPELKEMRGGEVFARALQRSPADRFESASQMRDALRKSAVVHRDHDTPDKGTLIVRRNPSVALSAFKAGFENLSVEELHRLGGGSTDKRWQFSGGATKWLIGPTLKPSVVTKYANLLNLDNGNTVLAVVEQSRFFVLESMLAAIFNRKAPNPLAAFAAAPFALINLILFPLCEANLFVLTTESVCIAAWPLWRKVRDWSRSHIVEGFVSYSFVRISIADFCGAQIEASKNTTAASLRLPVAVSGVDTRNLPGMFIDTESAVATYEGLRLTLVSTTRNPIG